MLWLSWPQFTSANAGNVANSVSYLLQSLLVFPLYFCQTGVVRRLVPSLLDAKSLAPSLADAMTLLSPLPARNSPATFAAHRYEVSASAATLAAYAVLGGGAVLLCLAAQAAVSLAVWGRGAGAWRPAAAAPDALPRRRPPHAVLRAGRDRPRRLPGPLGQPARPARPPPPHGLAVDADRRVGAARARQRRAEAVCVDRPAADAVADAVGGIV